jgi:CRISPR-associated exonuclease Cas4
MDENDFIYISALQHYAFCPRQCALIHVEQTWLENRFTAEGRMLHEKVDSGIAEKRGNTRYERSVSVKSEFYGLIGKMDLLVITHGEPTQYLPVEYKRGKPKIEDWDRIQVCAQALCLEEMRKISIVEGAIWYWESRHRELIQINDELRASTIAVIKQVRVMLNSGKTPLPTVDARRCRACSLTDLCGPKQFTSDHSKKYIDKIFLL